MLHVLFFHFFSWNSVDDVLLFSKDSWSLSVSAATASAFSERYLGSKTDSRVYSVKLFHHVPTLPRFLCIKVQKRWMIMKTNAICLLLFFPQMANLAQRAGQLAQKQYLIIHPTADGNAALSFLSARATFIIEFNANVVGSPISLPYRREGSLPAHGQIYQPPDQQKCQLHSTGELSRALNVPNCQLGSDNNFSRQKCSNLRSMVYKPLHCNQWNQAPLLTSETHSRCGLFHLLWTDRGNNIWAVSSDVYLPCECASAQMKFPVLFFFYSFMSP